MSEPSAADEATVSPPTGRPRREGNDSLWKRARRTLGTNSLTFLQPQSRPTGTSTSTSGSGPAAPSKRREQVRHAQRTHRQRTQNYIKTLESEVVRLRESDMKLMQERDKLQGQVDILRTTVAIHNISLPPGIEELPSASVPPRPLSDLDMPATVSYSADDFNHDRLHVNFPQQDLNQGLGYPTQTYPLASPYQNTHSGHDFPNDFSLHPMTVSTPSGNASDPKSSALVETIETAIDFVLALEHPCMPHILSPTAPPSDDPANHIMMASTPLLARSPDAPQLNQNWTASGAIIKELLNLSSSINLEGEITPVEAWHKLHQHPDFWRLDRKQIQNLKKELSTKVSCCGFGAVLDENAFWDAVNRALASAVSL